MDGNARFEIRSLALVVDVIDKGRKVEMKQKLCVPDILQCRCWRGQRRVRAWRISVHGQPLSFLRTMVLTWITEDLPKSGNKLHLMIATYPLVSLLTRFECGKCSSSD